MKTISRHGKQTFYYWPNLIGVHDTVVIFGAGGRGRQFSKFLKRKGISTKCFLDNDPAKSGTLVDGIPVLALDALTAEQKALPAIISCFQHCVVFLQIAPLFDTVYFDFNQNEYLAHVEQIETFEERIEKDIEFMENEESRKCYAGLADEVYSGVTDFRFRAKYRRLEHPRVHAIPGDTILGIGANTGTYIIDLCKKTDGQCKIHCFEPNNYYFPNLCSNIYAAGYQDNCILHCAGIWKSTGISFLRDPFDMARGRVDENKGSHGIFTWSVDEYVTMSGIKPTLIEVERAGLEDVLVECAKETIATYKPRLIIKYSPGTSTILSDLKKLVPEYVFYYGDHDLDTKKSLVGFLYAIAE